MQQAALRRGRGSHARLSFDLARGRHAAHARRHASNLFRVCDLVEKLLALPFNGPTVVVTHTAPSSRSIATRYEGSALNGSFVNNLDYMFEGDWAPTLWIHGHVHQAFDYRVNRTRVVCNPFGYASREDERDNGFDWFKVVEV